ncbi:hypothetical protein BBJ29_006534 [Phytophthora kernoviae]|uniref:Uncharacterized protein n=1 Tax=Phytophthora kernoviae TaxID=325452 RepID=A0A3F2RZ12_9STRA|nr:hypothetical protein BBJ29_006534 [Phytophthora kernoviae]RLN67058.1 hypothetical protein BBP00_00001848 [Phytophthora kernoviae]
MVTCWDSVIQSDGHFNFNLKTHNAILRSQDVPPIQELSTLIKKTTNEKEMLTKRLELALQMLHVLALLSPLDVLRIIKDELYLVVKLADALLHTAYVPLQQLYFMALTKLLGELNSRSNEVAAAAQRRLMESLKLLDSVLPTVLQPEEVIKLVSVVLSSDGCVYGT